MKMMAMFVGTVAAAAAGYYWLRHGRGELAEDARDAVETGAAYARRSAAPANDLLDDAVASA